MGIFLKARDAIAVISSIWRCDVSSARVKGVLCICVDKKVVVLVLVINCVCIIYRMKDVIWFR